MAIFTYLVFSLFISLLLVLMSKGTTKRPRLPPGPTGLPLIGNLHQLEVLSLHKHLWQLSQKHGPLMSFRLGFKPAIVVSSAKMAREVMKTHDLVFCGRPVLTGQKKLSYNCLNLAFAPHGDDWREIRKVYVLHLFSSSRVQSFRPIREDEVSRLIEKISASALASKPFNLSKAMVYVTNTIISRIACGKRDEDEGDEKQKFRQLLDEAQVMFSAFFFSDFFPFMGWLDRISGLRNHLEKVFEEIDAFNQEVIDEHLDPKRANPPESDREDILDVMLQLHKDRSSKVDLTIDRIKAILVNPKVMRKAQEEVRNSIGNNKGFVNEDDVQKLPYLKAVIKETMRLQPPAPLLIQRETNDKCNLGGYEIPAKTLVYVNAWAIGRDIEAWENPNEFYPDRFMINDVSIDLKGHNFELIPFGAGRRICPGLFMGIANVELSLANLLYKFNWEMPHVGMNSEDIDMDDLLPGMVPHHNDLYLLPEAYN